MTRPLELHQGMHTPCGIESLRGSLASKHLSHMRTCPITLFFNLRLHQLLHEPSINLVIGMSQQIGVPVSTEKARNHGQDGLSRRTGMYRSKLSGSNYPL